MNLSMTSELADAYKSGSQRAKNVTEAWGADNFYCPNCSSPKLDWLKPNTKANDYRCPNCGFWYQLKSQKTRIGNQINDGAYRAMMEAIQNDKAPSFYFMQYDLATWSVRNLLLVPHFAFPPSAIIKRKPLSPTARRAGWIGCNFALNRIPVDARIAVVTESRVTPVNEVREKFKRVKPLGEIKAKERGWTLDVLNIVRRLCEVGTPRRGVRGRLGCVKRRERHAASQPSLPNQRASRRDAPTTENEFTNEDVYAFDRELEKLHPDNRHVKDKIRQQLQVLRDLGLLLHIGSGVWRLP
jgi:type II restriction enzyme